MTITTTQIGTNTFQITLDGETTATGVISSIDAVLTGNGWSLHDAYNQDTHRVYRNLCKDGVTFKYLGLFIDTANLKIYTTVYETWNNTTHAGTNEANTFNRSGVMSFTHTACDIIIMLSPRWCILQTFIRNNPSPWSGIVECAREVAEDTPAAGYPPFAWVCSLFVTSNATGSHSYFSFPRSRSGGYPVADGIQTPYIRLGSQTGLSGQSLVADSIYTWDTSKRTVHSLRPTFGNNEVHGKVFGLKACFNIGSPFNRVSMPVDTDFNFSSTGVDTEHWVLGNTASPTALSTILSTGTPASGYASGFSQSTLPGQGRSVAFTGTTYYVTLHNGIAKIDATSATVQATASVVTGAPAADHGDIIFDGRYIYAAGATFITRIDTLNNDAVTMLALPQGATSLFFDGTWLWCSARTSLVNNAFYKIDPATFTISSTLTQINSAGAFIAGITTDFSGNLFTIGTDGKINKIVISTGVVSTIANVTASVATNLMYNGSLLSFIWMASNYFYVGTVTTAGFNPSTIETLTTTGVAMLSTAPGGTQKLSFSKLHNSTISTYGQQNAGTNYIASSKGCATFSSIQSTAGNYPIAVYSTNATMYGFTYNTFCQYTGLCHPDNATTILNRLLLPK